MRRGELEARLFCEGRHTKTKTCRPLGQAPPALHLANTQSVLCSSCTAAFWPSGGAWTSPTCFLEEGSARGRCNAILPHSSQFPSPLIHPSLGRACCLRGLFNYTPFTPSFNTIFATTGHQQTQSHKHEASQSTTTSSPRSKPAGPASPRRRSGLPTTTRHGLPPSCGSTITTLLLHSPCCHHQQPRRRQHQQSRHPPIRRRCRRPPFPDRPPKQRRRAHLPRILRRGGRAAQDQQLHYEYP